MVSEVLHPSAPVSKRHPHRIQVDIPPGIAMDSQPGALGQILINLVNNAYLHAFEGCSQGRAQAERTGPGRHGGYHRDRQRRGHAPRAHGQDVPAFFSTKIGQGGTGLGMAIVQNLVTKSLGGHITVQSTVGEGTQFHIVLPRRAPEPMSVAIK